MTTSAPFDGVDRMVIGGYTSEADGHAPGLVVLAAPRQGMEPVIEFVADATSPSYVIAHPSRPCLFTAGEAAPATVASYRLDGSGRLDLLSQLPTGGEFACHLSLTADAARLLVSNYGTGSVASYAVGEDGALAGPLDVLSFTGSGPDHERQEGPHAHQTLIVGDEILVCDLGTDRIHRLRADSAGQFERAAAPIELPPGAGPRHAVVVGELLVVACELSSELWVGRRQADGWTQVQRVSSTSSSADPRQPSGIVTDGRTVTVATRGPDTISTFAADADGVRLLAEVPTGGEWPRDLTLRGDHLWVANQTSGTVTVFDLSDPAAPEQVERFAAPSATCVVLLPQEFGEIS